MLRKCFFIRKLILRNFTQNRALLKGLFRVIFQVQCSFSWIYWLILILSLSWLRTSWVWWVWTLTFVCYAGPFLVHWCSWCHFVGGFKFRSCFVWKGANNLNLIFVWFLVILFMYMFVFLCFSLCTRTQREHMSK